MSSGALRRRLHHGDSDGGKHDHYEASSFDSLNEALLGNGDYKEHSEAQALQYTLDDERKEEHLHWTFLFSNIISQWAQWLANILIGFSCVLGRIIPFIPGSHSTVNSIPPAVLSPLQDALRKLWKLAYSDRPLPSLKSEAWKDMGWQGQDPSTDFRGGGYISLENLIFFASTFPEAFQNLLHKRDGERSEWEYPFAVAGINVSFMLIQMLDLQSNNPSTIAGHRFLELLSDDEMAFDNLFCVAFELLDAQWLARRASYMDFNDVLKATRSQLERELALEDISTIRDLPAFSFLIR